MCISCGCGHANDAHGDSRNITLGDLDQAAQAAGTTRDQVIQNIAQCAQSSSQAGRGDYYQSQSEQVKTSGRKPGEVSPELGQDSGTAWQESQQMGETGHGGVQNPQTNP